MKKAEADAIKSEFTKSPDYSHCLEFMSQEDIDRHLNHLELFQMMFEDEITDYCLDDSHDLMDEEDLSITRAYWFSKGMDDHFICLTGDGNIRTLSGEFPYDLLAHISHLMHSLMEEE